MNRVPVLALVGRPNVGKSTLFNRMTGSRAALVADRPGLTRDRHYGRARVGESHCIVIDTGGFEPVAKGGIEYQMARQARQAVLEADVVLFIVDGRQGLTGHDRDIAAELRKSARKLIVVVNKTEGMSRETVSADFHELGLGQPLAVSAAHGDGVRDLLEIALEGLLPPPRGYDDTGDQDPFANYKPTPAPAAGAAGAAEDASAAGGAAVPGGAAAIADADVLGGETGATGPVAPGDAQAIPLATPATRRIRVAVVGRPNAGKSTLINTLLGEERLIAFDQPGTTRDAVAIDFEKAGRPYTLIDTAGVRRRGKVTDMIEKFSVVKTLQAIEDCNVCVLMLDALEGVAEQDANIAGYILEAGRALVVAVNKWDLLAGPERERLKSEFDRKLHFLRFAKLHMISAKSGMGVGALMRSVDEAYSAAMRKLPTPKLTRALQEAVERQQPPRRGPVRPKLRYAHQGGQNPPIVVIHGSALDNVPETYRRYLETWFREQFSLSGTPLRIEFRSGPNPYADN
ncbi:MAG: ribosome biogenesis GTPase Der [Burkholderiaceae bacterium]|nr:ribosome biogenesis GTPase Der [Burkholderiaceae bacterium]